ncbi:Cytoplasmic tRNA 2-thiolation protein 2 [Dispira parvispora]|uniref:Cytoplasmic tRNA 2-thiolation protein 2 n=1 Tax=Dispira parvispora TaxID=1520584 RepID=A0A9W8AP37_9FUNG|nr:Cytoplasmic tRNA 2-thiolation protein 2 [Dispira parvispora]
MCDANNDSTPAPVSKGRQPKRSNDICHKCGLTKPAVRIRHTYYCNPCFKKSFVNKFRSTMGKALRLSSSHKPRVLMGYSGGTSSRALLNLVGQYSRHEFVTDDRDKFAKLVVCHIDTTGLFPEQPHDTEGIRQSVEAAYPHVTYDNVPLEQVLTLQTTNDPLTGGWLMELSPVSDAVAGDFCFIPRRTLTETQSSPAHRLTELFQAATKLSTKEDLLEHLKFQLLVQRAIHHQCDYIILGDTCTRLAIRTLANTGKGRGFALPLSLGGHPTWFNGIEFIRPLRECLVKEAALYNHLEQLQVFPTPSFTTLRPTKSSINKLTEDFIYGLDRDFPSTTSAVTRTAGKLKASDQVPNNAACLLCLMPVERDSVEWKTAITVRTCPNSADPAPTGESTVTAPPHPVEVNSADSPLRLTNYFCYACQTTLSEMRPGAQLPLLIYNESQGAKDPKESPVDVGGDQDTTMGGSEKVEQLSTRGRLWKHSELYDQIANYLLE